jgi:hypothetical protein
LKIKNEYDFWSGVMFFLFGLIFFIGAMNYEFGFTKRMGPAYFPTILGGILILLGFVIGLKGLAFERNEEKLERFHIGPIAFVITSIIIFALLIHRGGLILSIISLVGISMLGSHEFKWKEAVTVSVVMAIIVWAIFIYGLNFTIPVLPVF